jgi:CRP/FNR family transcriptional regulator, cyclic AMP receptor protein
MSIVQTHDQYAALLQRAGDADTYAPAETIFREGDAADRMYVVKSGLVTLACDGRQLERVGPGGIFGEMALIDSAPRSASAIAETACELVPIETRRFWFLVHETPYFAQLVMRVMAERLRRETGQAGPEQPSP